MPRLARAAIPGLPYHVTHRGNRRQPVFLADEDRAEYLDDLAACAERAGLRIWAYCLITDHVHLIAVPEREDSLARGLGRAHQRHTRRINRRLRSTGLLWGERFYSTPLDELQLWTGVNYVESNPVRAGLARRAEDWPWASAPANADRRRRDPLLDPDRPTGGPRPHPLTGRPLAWAAWLALGLEQEAIDRLRKATSTGRPCGTKAFIQSAERKLDRILLPQKPGPRPGTARKGGRG